MEIEAEDFDVPKKCYGTLESILEKARKEINPESKPKKILSKIAKIIRKSGIKYKKSGLLSQTLQTKRMDCRYYSVLYYSIGEELGLPLNIVFSPYHVFIRWDDGKNIVNWEATSGKKFNEKRYIFDSDIHEKALSLGVYLKNLTRQEAKSIVFDARANEKQKNKDLEGSIADFSKAIELDQNNAELHNNRGLMKDKKKDLKNALADFIKAINLDPNLTQAYLNRGVIKWGYGNIDEAFADFNKAIEINPDFALAYYNRGLMKEDEGDLKGAKTDFKMYKKLKEKKEKENH